MVSPAVDLCGSTDRNLEQVPIHRAFKPNHTAVSQLDLQLGGRATADIGGRAAVDN